MKKKGCFFFIACVIVLGTLAYFKDRCHKIRKEFERKEFSDRNVGEIKVIISGSYSSRKDFPMQSVYGNPYSLLLCIDSSLTINNVKPKQIFIMDAETKSVLYEIPASQMQYQRGQSSADYYEIRGLHLQHRPLAVKISFEIDTPQEKISKDIIFHIDTKYKEYYSSHIWDMLSSV